MTSRRLLIFQEARNPQNPSELVYVPVNKLGLPICGPGPDLPSILELPLRILRAFTEIFNQPKFKGWAVVSAGPYHDTSEEGKYYAVVLEQVRDASVSNTSHIAGARDSVGSNAGLPTNTHLLLIFRKATPTGDSFILLNEQGLPISNTSPLLAAEGKMMVVAPLLLVAVTEAIRANGEVFEGFEYLMSWTANDYKHFYVILEKRPQPQPKNKPDDPSSSSWDSNNNDSNNDNNNTSTNEWGNNDNNNDTSNNDNAWGSGNDTSNDNLDSGWGANSNNNNDTSNNNNNNNNNGGWGNDNNNNSNTTGNNEWSSGAPPGSPINNTNSNNNSFQNHSWPSSLLSANRSSGGGGGGGGSSWGNNGNGNGKGSGAGTTSPSGFGVRDWAMSPGDGGGNGNGSGSGSGWGFGSQGATSTAGGTTPKSEW